MLRILEYHRDNPDLTSVLYRDAIGSDEHFSTRVKELTTIANRQLLEEFKLLHRAGVLRECRLEVVVTIIMGSVLNVIMEHIVGCADVDLEALVDELMQYHVRALIRADTDLSDSLNQATVALEEFKKKS